tara:strand:- start:15337 stop:15519 length:183 start_codon:yes stop_codon:yes gene_type:complete
MKLVYMLIVMTSFNHTLSSIPYQTMDDCLAMARQINLPYLATCTPKIVSDKTETYKKSVK